MAGFEVIVRPVVLPNIRPTPRRVLPPQDDPSQGFCTIGGSGGGLVDLPRSWNVSVSRQEPEEEEVRQFDKERIHQKDKDGKINKENFVEVERLKRVRLNGSEGPVKMLYADPPKADNVETLQTDVTRRSEPT